ncbi:MAG: protein-disulfide reductase DsbD family protein, partial [Candidatus Omnitrophota bacterium]|nr:protein-disulfide reductase DsbD family protein [Candidatus Omnitrophota bacterium]
MFFLLLVSPAQAGSVYQSHTYVELVSEVSAIKPGEPFWAGVRLKTDKNWHTYWRNPGDSGLPTKIIWQLPDGFTASPIYWPYPHRWDAEGLTTYIYPEDVYLLTQIFPQDKISKDSITLQVHVDWLACEVPCIPGRADLSLDLPVREQSQQNPGQKENFERARAQWPVNGLN